jgi:hypothetical protein
MRRRAGLALVLASLALPAGAAGQARPALKSDRVSYLGTVDEPQVVSARFRGTLMYLSTLRGLSIYDVSNPTAPVLRGRLALPHFQNEDVDMAMQGNILLISADPNEGAGVLFVIDISNPAAPARIGQLVTGFSDGSLQIIPNFFLGFAGLSAPVPAGIGHTASCIPPDCRHAILAGNLNGVLIVDLTDPTAPKELKRIPVEEANAGVATHDVQFDQNGLAWIAGGGGVAAYRISDLIDPANADPAAVVVPGAEARSDYLEDTLDDGQNPGDTLNDFIHHNSIRLRNESLRAPPPGSDPAADSDTLLVVEEDYQRPSCDGAGSFQTWRIQPDATLTNLDEWRIERPADNPDTDASFGQMCSAHYMDERLGLVAQGWYDQGTRFLDVSRPADIRQVGYWIPDGALTWGAYFPPTDPDGEVVYSLDFPRGIDVLRFTRPRNTLAGLQEPDPAAPEDKAGRGPNGPFQDPGSAPDRGGPGQGSSENVALARPAPRVTVRVRGPERLEAGRRARYRVVVRNAGAAAGAVKVRVRLSSRLQHLRGGRLSGRTVRWNLGAMAAGEARTLTLVVRARRAVSQRPSASDNARMATVRAPARRTSGRRPVTFQSRFGAVCRVVVSVSG